MIKYILEDLQREALPQPSNDGHLEAWLQQLQKVATKLFDSYRNSEIKIDYDKFEIQAVYMLRYFPYYHIPLQCALEDVEASSGKLSISHLIQNVIFIGSGPTPELLGFLRYLNRTGRSLSLINAFTFDLNSEQWKRSRDITFNTLFPLYFPNTTLTSSNFSLDLTSTDCFCSFEKYIDSCDFSIIQNCLNELPVSKRDLVVDNMIYFSRYLKRGAVFVIIDFVSYGSINRTIDHMIEKFEALDLFDVLAKTSDEGTSYDAYRTRDKLPKILTDNLLTGEDGLIAKRNLNFRYICLKKK